MELDREAGANKGFLKGVYKIVKPHGENGKMPPPP